MQKDKPGAKALHINFDALEIEEKEHQISEVGSEEEAS